MNGTEDVYGLVDLFGRSVRLGEEWHNNSSGILAFAGSRPEPSDLVKTYLPNGTVIDPKCSWAQWIDGRTSNGEIRVSRQGGTFAAPVLIVHYIEEHHYLPPEQFLKAIEEAPGL